MDHPVTPGPRHALLVVDVQNDFCPGGSLPVPSGDAIIPAINIYLRYFSKREMPVFASRDWHPPRSRHFKEEGGPWPAHCVQDTPGAGFHRALRLPASTIILSKGMAPEDQGYSAFEGVDTAGRTFDEVLKTLEVNELSVCGLATEFCVKETVFEALKRGYRVNLLLDAIQGMNATPRTSEGAIKEMLAKGAACMTWLEFASSRKVRSYSPCHNFDKHSPHERLS